MGVTLLVVIGVDTQRSLVVTDVGQREPCPTLTPKDTAKVPTPGQMATATDGQTVDVRVLLPLIVGDPTYSGNIITRDQCNGLSVLRLCLLEVLIYIVRTVLRLILFLGPQGVLLRLEVETVTERDGRVRQIHSIYIE